MFQRLDHMQLLRYAGLLSWAVMALPLWMMIGSMQGGDADGATAGAGAALLAGWPACVAWLVFGISYGLGTRGLGARRGTALDYLLVLLLTGSAIAISYYSHSGLGSILLMVVASVLPWLLPLPVGIAWLVLGEFVVVPVYHRWVELSWGEALMQALLYCGFTGFVFVTGFVARQQALAREEQRRLNAELRATRALLAESVRVNERTRIARELHDLLGHHLTALSLNLEVAGHLVQGKAQEHVNQSHTLAKLLLSDVRDAVGTLRSGDAIDMAATLAPLAEKVPGLHIDMQMPRPFMLDDAERAHVLLRCTQEIITNAVRHAQAQTLLLRYAVDAHCVRVHARDDGHGAEAGVRAGNGLSGMRERLAAFGGSAAVQTAPGQGFVLDLTLPLDTPARPALSVEQAHDAPQRPAEPEPGAPEAPLSHLTQADGVTP